ncbi:hypothetical protein [Paracoccus lutimaris]|uniref:Uncharacterized protein n=1 Tax=Paracoccus lutimaris TaxID=1490030 RepID=A0A368Z3U9_9RHOB|nr:hypothetical protein [Paracoccus lutimaris]RCW86619.1 hypothetical protein DFP89_1043 [Paracoccus lutimaris]
MKHHQDQFEKANERKRLRRERDARRDMLGAGRFDALVKELAAVIRLAFEAGATASLFGLEGPLRAGIRADLCRQGWRWIGADDMAREILAEAFRRVNAVRPSWEEGQQEWAIHAGTLIERTRCVRCHKPLPEGHFKFCSNTCGASHHQRMATRKWASDETAVRLAINSI